MSTFDPLTTDPVALIDRLDPGTIRRELDELARREAALRILLRSALARRRQAAPTRPPAQDKQSKGANHG